MRNTNKKGFTIVELVVVVAVIAILAAVLIPTVSGIIRKANISADTVVAKQLNNAAIAADADTFDEAIEAVKDAGYNIANLNAKASECYFVWEDESNQFILYDLKNTKILYSNTTVANDEPDADWCFAVSNPTVADAVQAVLPAITVKKTVANIADLMANIETGGVIYMDDNVVIDAANIINVKNGADVTINLGNSTLNTSENLNGTPLNADKASLTIVGGVLGATGTVTAEEDVGAAKPEYTMVVSVEGTKDDILSLQNTKINVVADNVIAASGNTVNLDGVDITVEGGFMIEIERNTTLNIKNANVVATSMGYGALFIGNLTDAGTNASVTTIESGKFAGYWLARIAGPSELYIKGGEYIYDSCDAIKSETQGATLGGVDNVEFFDFVQDTVKGSKIVISGGTFNGVDYWDISETDWVKVCRNRTSGTITAVKDNATKTVTITLN